MGEAEVPPPDRNVDEDRRKISGRIGVASKNSDPIVAVASASTAPAIATDQQPQDGPLLPSPLPFAEGDTMQSLSENRLDTIYDFNQYDEEAIGHMHVEPTLSSLLPTRKSSGQPSVPEKGERDAVSTMFHSSSVESKIVQKHDARRDMCELEERVEGPTEGRSRKTLLHQINSRVVSTKAIIDQVQSHYDEEQDHLMEIKRKVDEMDHLKSRMDKEQKELDDMKDRLDRNTLPEDIYSMMMISAAGSGAAFFSVCVFAFQISLLILIILDFYDTPEGSPPFNPPASVSLEVRVSQFFAIIVALATQDDVFVSISTLLALWKNNDWKEFVDQLPTSSEEGQSREVKKRGPTYLCFWCYCCCLSRCLTTRLMYYVANGFRFAEGILGLLISMIIIITSNNVIDLFKDFAAMAFISMLDNVAFSLAGNGFLGTSLFVKAEEVRKHKVPEINRTTGRFTLRFVMFALFASMAGGWGYVVYQQKNGAYLPQSLIVQFGDDENFAIQLHSGIYERSNRDKASDRFVYTETETESRVMNERYTGYFFYCLSENSWAFGIFDFKPQEFESNRDWVCQAGVMMATSPKTEQYDPSTLPMSGWSISNGMTMVPLTFISVASFGCSEDKDCGSSKHDDGKIWVKGKCNKALSPPQCECTGNFYGNNCQFQPPCNTIELRHIGTVSSTGSDNYAGSYSVLLSDTKVHGERVYVSDDRNKDEYNLLLFAGRRWVLLNTASPSIVPVLDSPDSSSVIDQIKYISEPTSGGTPEGLNWYRTVVFDNNSNELTTHIIEAISICTEYGLNEDYPTCNVSKTYLLGNSHCDGGAYNTEQCGWDGGDCKDFNARYPDCKVEYPSRIGDGYCDGEYNNGLCKLDGGDCKDFDARYPDCKVEYPSRIGDGYCDGEYNNGLCKFDGGDCRAFNRKYPLCNVSQPTWIGNGRCDAGAYNSKECGWDDGDCAVEGYPECRVDNPSLVRNEVCDGELYNVSECGYDGGYCITSPEVWPSTPSPSSPPPSPPVDETSDNSTDVPSGAPSLDPSAVPSISPIIPPSPSPTNTTNGPSGAPSPESTTMPSNTNVSTPSTSPTYNGTGASDPPDNSNNTNATAPSKFEPPSTPSPSSPPTSPVDETLDNSKNVPSGAPSLDPSAMPSISPISPSSPPTNTTNGPSSRAPSPYSMTMPSNTNSSSPGTLTTYNGTGAADPLDNSNSTNATVSSKVGLSNDSW